MGLGRETTVNGDYDLADTDETPTMSAKQQRVLATAGTEERLAFGGISGLIYLKALDYDLDVDTSYSGTFNSELTIKAGESQIFRPTRGQVYVKNTNDDETPEYKYCLIGNILDLTTACVAHYKMNDDAASTVVIDSQGYSNGTAQRNTNLLTTAGKVNNALNFLAENGIYVNTNSSFNDFFNADFSIALWAKPDDGQPGSTKALLGFWDDEAQYRPEIQVHINRYGKLSFKGRTSQESAEGGWDVISDVVFSDGQETWHFIVITAEQIDDANCTFNLYLDGTLIGTQTRDQVLSEFNTDLDLYIGTTFVTPDGRRFYFDGDIDNLMFFNKTLSQAEMDFLYNNGNGTEGLKNT